MTTSSISYETIRLLKGGKVLHVASGQWQPIKQDATIANARPIGATSWIFKTAAGDLYVVTDQSARKQP